MTGLWYAWHYGAAPQAQGWEPDRVYIISDYAKAVGWGAWVEARASAREGHVW